MARKGEYNSTGYRAAEVITSDNVDAYLWPWTVYAGVPAVKVEERVRREVAGV